MKLLLVAFALCTSVAHVQCGRWLGDYVLNSNCVAATISSVNDCKLCEDECKKVASTCTAYSFSDETGKCLLATCGVIEIKKSSEYVTFAMGDPTIFSVDLPSPRHNLPLTDKCGLSSYGSNHYTSVNARSLNFQNSNSQNFGNALHYSNHNNVITYPDATLAQYASATTSLTLAFMVYFDAIPPNACLFEFHNDQRLSWHYWLWPNAGSIYHNGVTDAFTSLTTNYAYTFAAKKWYHFGFSFNAANGRHDQYVNGVLVGTTYLTFVAKQAINAFTIGGRFNDNLGFFDGSTYCLSIFDQPLTVNQVNEHMRSCVAGQVHILCDDGCK